MPRNILAVLVFALAALGGCAREPAPSVPMVASEEGPASRPGKAARSDHPVSAPRPRPIDETDTEDPVDEILRSIRTVSPTEHVITRRGADLLLENQAAALHTVRITPELRSGTLLGLRLFGVTPDSFLGQIGFENGDVLERVGGKAIDSPEKALEAYSALRHASVIDIDIERRGAPMHLRLRIE